MTPSPVRLSLRTMLVWRRACTRITMLPSGKSLQLPSRAILAMAGETRSPMSRLPPSGRPSWASAAAEVHMTLARLARSKSACARRGHGDEHARQNKASPAHRVDVDCFDRGSPFGDAKAGRLASSARLRAVRSQPASRPAGCACRRQTVTRVLLVQTLAGSLPAPVRARTSATRTSANRTSPAGVGPARTQCHPHQFRQRQSGPHQCQCHPDQANPHQSR